MTVSSSFTDKVYAIDGTTTRFPWNQDLDEQYGSLVVTEETESSNGLVVKTYVEGTDYNIEVKDVVFVTAPSDTSHYIRITRNTYKGQPVVFNEGEDFPAEDFEHSLDRLAMIAQENAKGLADEKTARIAADTTLDNKITAETTRATGVEGSLSNLTTTAKTSLVAAINEVDEAVATINATIETYGDVVTHDADEFATAAQGALADTAVQPDDLHDLIAVKKSVSFAVGSTTVELDMSSDVDSNITYYPIVCLNDVDSTTVSRIAIYYTTSKKLKLTRSTSTSGTTFNAYICLIPTTSTETSMKGVTNGQWTDSTYSLCYTKAETDALIPTVNNATLTITQGGATKGTFTANASENETIELDAGSATTSGALCFENATATFSDSTLGYVDVSSEVEEGKAYTPIAVFSNATKALVVDYCKYKISTKQATIKQKEKETGTLLINFLFLIPIDSTVSGNVIDGLTNVDVDTTYSAFTGADGVNAGTSGLVPAPAATDNVKYLKGDGTFSQVAYSEVSGTPSLSGYQTTSNLVTSVDSGSTDSQYPSALCLYTMLGNVEDLINAL